ncbi:branched-chain-amino-acid aminotransferase-like protein 2 [Anneissia japonica]|uniref:branched-chain-amino-acid aminotransferase-like protein 2 n=1 Tax=Anneissia japonica TaxID=1529436 RepID=UPI0014256610|nr:branched-chain-amino-acid aminotransferase-like protein 2 [Anneissia japonica]
MASESTTRVILWSAPRCMSTAFMRSINTLDDSVVFHENFTAAYLFGPEGNGKKLFSLAPYYTYDYVKALLEQEIPNKEVIFVKDFPFALKGNFEKIPDGYVHTFLIRNPTKVFMSIRDQYNTWIKRLYLGKEIQTYQPASRKFFEDLWKLYVYVKDNLKKPALIIDVDDFLRDPEAMMKIYCQSTGIPFRKSMLSWEPCSVWKMDWHCSTVLKFCGWWNGWYDKMLNSNGFGKSKMRTTIPDVTMLPKDVRDVVEISEPYYKLMYDKRIKC